MATLRYVVLSGLVALASASTSTKALLHQPTDAASQAKIFGFAKDDGTPKICSLHCDGRDPTLAQEDNSPVNDVKDGKRITKLRFSDADVMAWASVTGGKDHEVWIERTWNADESDAEQLGKTKEQSTQMFNLADPNGHRRGMVRACSAKKGAEDKQAKCTNWIKKKACEATSACDGDDVANVEGGYFPVPVTSLDGRTLELHMDNGGMAWGTIRAAQANDEVWINRSWDPDVGDNVEELGRTRIPEGENRADTKLFATRDTKLLMFGGAVRACARIKDGKSRACTNWARPTSNHALSAIDALMYDLQIYTAWWLSSWWNSAVATHTIIDYMLQSGDGQYMWFIERSYTLNKQAYEPGVKSTDELYGDFLSRAIDDALWWGLAWADAYELTGNKTYLEAAKIVADYSHEFYDNSTCDGGVWWDEERTYKNAVTNGQHVKLSAQLHRLIDNDTTYKQRAETAWQWYVNSGMINSAFLINDGLTDSCENNNGTVWTYNQGLAIGAAVEMYRITKDTIALNHARSFADAAINESNSLTVDGILTESCDEAGTCDDNQKQFKGIFMRFMGDLAKETKEEKYVQYVQKQASVVWKRNRDALNRLGQAWNGGANNAHDWRTQASAAGALNAELAVRN